MIKKNITNNTNIIKFNLHPTEMQMPNCNFENFSRIEKYSY